MRLIDADELEEKAWRFGLGTREDVVNLIRNAPTVEPKHGYWICKKYPLFSCSVCGAIENADLEMIQCDTEYCPHCGAKMDEVENE